VVVGYRFEIVGVPVVVLVVVSCVVAGLSGSDDGNIEALELPVGL
jgi:hypothetical protein